MIADFNIFLRDLNNIRERATKLRYIAPPQAVPFLKALMEDNHQLIEWVEQFAVERQILTPEPPEAA